MKKGVFAILLSFASGWGVGHAADALGLVEDLGLAAGAADACKASFTKNIAECRDDVIEGQQLGETERQELLQAYAKRAEEGRRTQEENPSAGCGDVLRSVKRQPFWTQCPTRKPR